MASSLYLELSSKELNLIISEALHTAVASARLLTGGLFNTTYLVETADFGRVVLRAGPVNRHLLMPFEHRLMEAESIVYELCAKRGVAVSEVLAADTSKKLIDRDFMIVRYIPSSPMSEAALAPCDIGRISRDIGEAVRKMHDIKAPRFGRITDVTNGGGFSLWSECLLNELHEWERVGKPARLFSDSEHERIVTLFEKAAPVLDRIKEPCLVHTDLWFGNILISNESGKSEFAAIIDADRALFGDPDFEFSSIKWTHSQKSFWQGYGKELSSDRSGIVRRSIYELLCRLWNAYVYLIEYNQPEQAETETASARQQIALLGSLTDM